MTTRGRRGVTGAVVRKDLATLWSSPLPWVVGALLHAALGLLYFGDLQARQQALIQPMVPLAGFLLLAAAPVLSMRSFAEESRSGTLDLLLAVPARPRPLVLGKWLAAWGSALGVLAPAGAYVVLLRLWGRPDTGPVVSGFVGLVLFCAALTAIGVLTSSLSSSQPVAAVVALFVTLILWFAHVGSGALAAGPLLAHLSISERLRSFAAGVIDSGDVAFLAVVTVAALLLAMLAVDARRLR